MTDGSTGRDSKFPRRRGQTGIGTLPALLQDPDTVHAAAAAVALADGGASCWPFAIAVGTDTVKVNMTGIDVPLPRPPWRVGHEPHVWVVDRSAVTGRTFPVDRLVVVGRFRETVVFVDTTRAPGPLLVSGEPENAARVRELISAQTRDRTSQKHRNGGSYWPMSVRGGVVVLLGLGICFVFSPDDSRRAAALMRSAADAAAASPGTESTRREPAVRRTAATTTRVARADATNAVDDVDRWIGVLRAGDPRTGAEPAPPRGPARPRRAASPPPATPPRPPVGVDPFGSTSAAPRRPSSPPARPPAPLPRPQPEPAAADTAPGRPAPRPRQPPPPTPPPPRPLPRTPTLPPTPAAAPELSEADVWTDFAVSSADDGRRR